MGLRYHLGFTGIGATVVIVNGVPIPVAHVSLRIGSEVVLVRDTTQSYERQQGLSDQEITMALIENYSSRYGNTPRVFSQNLALERSGEIVLDPDTGVPAVLDSQAEFNSRTLADIESASLPNQVRESLSRIGVDFAVREGGVSIEALTPRDAPADIKYVIDPDLNNLATIRDGRIFIGNVSEQDLRGLIVTRENFHYPFPQRGHTSMSIITIKRNPFRTRHQIEQESDRFAYKRAGYPLQLRQGRSLSLMQQPDSSQNFLREEEFGRSEVGATTGLDSFAQTELSLTPVEAFNRADFDDFVAFQSDALRVAPDAPRQGFDANQFAKSFIDSNPREYRALSTLGRESYNPQELTRRVQEFARSQELGELNVQELNTVMLSLARESFVQARKGRERQYLERHLEVAINNVFSPIFSERREKLGLSEGDVSEMLSRIRTDVLGTNLDDLKHADFESGTLFLSMVGSMNIRGLRGVPNYSSELDVANGIINFNRYDPAAPGVEGNLGKMFLELLSPIPQNDIEFMSAPLPLKLASSRTLYLLMGREDSRKVVESFGSRRIDATHRAAFDRFRGLIQSIRDAQHRGGNFVRLDNGFEIAFDTQVGMGVYDKCMNPTLAGFDNLRIYPPLRYGESRETRRYVTVGAREEQRDIINLTLGIAITPRRDRPKEPPPEDPPPEQPPPDQPPPDRPTPDRPRYERSPSAGPGGEVDLTTGGVSTGGTRVGPGETTPQGGSAGR
jgi:hypothetical protein